MAELIFYTGPMGSSKTAHALMTNFQYKEKGKSVWLIKPAIDTREEMQYHNGKAVKTLVKSRVGITAWADAIPPNSHIVPRGWNESCFQSAHLTFQPNASPLGAHLPSLPCGAS